MSVLQLAEGPLRTDYSLVALVAGLGEVHRAVVLALLPVVGLDSLFAQVKMQWDCKNWVVA